MKKERVSLECLYTELASYIERAVHSGTLFCKLLICSYIIFTYIAGTNNVIADGISWFQMQHFRSMSLDANPQPDHIHVFDIDICVHTYIVCGYYVSELHSLYVNHLKDLGTYLEDSQ